ncbi:hypothetical protein [Roseomonas indoligenes]|uniref:Uncharacterized protein n=1 Tax=Roseomonas indoligenes TaxID=2820811 RepID=A0A940SA30_9PROT|nr:hypothetical protein [Pararoseomonas indoligenes]MBP0495762.1 hypothetical protein [Pararoseomonas indoligenes]
MSGTAATAASAVPELEASSFARDEADGETRRGAPGHGEAPRGAATVAGAELF